MNNLGLLHRQQQRTEDVRKEWKEGLKIGRERIQKNPQSFIPDVAMIVKYVGVLYTRQRRMEKAGKECKGALTLERDLTQKNPKTYMPQLTKTLSNLRARYFENLWVGIPERCE